MPLRRDDLRHLAELRLREAEALLAADCPVGAYYLAGYAAELGMKACIAGQFRSDEIPDWALKQLKIHRLPDLLIPAGLDTHLEDRCAESGTFERNWTIVASWKVDVRYRMDSTSEDAAALIEALSQPSEGVIPWIRTHW